MTTTRPAGCQTPARPTQPCRGRGGPLVRTEEAKVEARAEMGEIGGGSGQDAGGDVRTCRDARHGRATETLSPGASPAGPRGGQAGARQLEPCAEGAHGRF